jgi:hypothetical protein
VASFGDEDNGPAKRINPNGEQPVDHFLQSDQFLFCTDVPRDDDQFNEVALYVSTEGGCVERWANLTN